MIKRWLDRLCWWRHRKQPSVLAMIKKELEANPNRRIHVDLEELRKR